MPNPLQAALDRLRQEPPRRTQIVALRSSNGSYVCAEGGGANELVVNRPAIGPWETFALIWLADDSVAIVAVNGKLVSLFQILAISELLAPVSDVIGTNETFRLIWHPDDRITLQAANGSFVCAEGGGGGSLLANRPAIGDWEKFWLEVPPPL